MQQLAFDAVESARDFGFKPDAYTEMAISEMALSEEDRVLPLISRLSHQQDERWLTCVNTPVIDKGMAAAADIQAQQLLQVQAPARLDTAEVIKKALRSGRSHTVVGFCDELTSVQREELRQCAELADCQCLVLTRQ